MPTKKKATTAPPADLPFEDAVERLEEIIGRMEGERVPLDALLRDYKEGTELLKLCRSRIEGARAQIEQINTDLAASPGNEEGAAPDQPDEEVQLL